jgi:hypothetical protein
MANDLFKAVLINDGQGVTDSDLTNISKFNLSRLAEQMFERMAGTLAVASKDPEYYGTNTALTSLIYTLTGGDAVIKQGSSNTKVTLTPGTIFQKLASTDGNEAQFIPYTVGASDVDLTIGAGGANPRIDILQVKLEWESGNSASRDFEDATTGAKTTQTTNTHRRVKATFSIKAGTTAATPVYPTPDAGYAVIAAIRVPAGWASGIGIDAAGFTSAILRQCSIPLGIEAITVTPGEFDYSMPGLAGWRRGTSGDGLSIHGSAYAASAGTDLCVWVPNGTQGKRIVGVKIQAKWATSGTVELVSWRYNTLTGYGADASKVDLSSVLVTTGGTLQEKFAHLGQIADGSSDSDPTAAAGPIGDPFWASGGKSGPARRENEFRSNEFQRSALLIDAGSGSIVVAVTFYLAG